MYNLFVFFVLSLIALSSPAFAGETLDGRYMARVTEVIDGDTFRARVHVWLGQEVETLVRLDGIDAPELHSKCARERALARQSRAYLRDMIEGRDVSLYDIRRDKYGGRIRARAVVSGQAAKDIAGSMRAGGHSRVYGGKGARKPWC